MALPELLSLFASAFLAATLFPAQSEAVLVLLSHSGRFSPALLVGVATLGNVLGACVNWGIGRYLMHFQDRKWFPIKGPVMSKATVAYQRWGVWTLLLAWLPFIGDPLTLVAGIFRTRFLVFLPLVTVGKALRYCGVVALVG